MTGISPFSWPPATEEVRSVQAEWLSEEGTSTCSFAYSRTPAAPQALCRA